MALVRPFVGGGVSFVLSLYVIDVIAGIQRTNFDTSRTTVG